MAELTYTVTINATPITLTLNKGTDGLTPYIGENGNWWIGLTDTGVSATPNGIESITLFSTVGFVKTYRILFTDSTHFDYEVSDGAKGDKGDDGDDGLTTSIALNGTTYEQTGGTITLPDLLPPDGDGSSVMSEQDVNEVYTTDFPGEGASWGLSTWFGVIRAKIDRLFSIKLDTTGNGSDTIVNFTEAGATALPATGEAQSTLWGKVLRYFKTEIPTLLNAKISIQGGDATNAVSASNESMTYGQTWPTYATKWALLNWFGAIRAKIDYLFNVSSKMLYVTASRPTSTDEWTFNAFSTIEFASISSKAYLGIPIIVRFAGTTNGIAEPIMLYPGLWNETLSQITSRDLARGFYLNGGVASNRGARSYDTQKYIDLGATFNNTTGFYEYLGLTDIVESECREAYYLTPKRSKVGPDLSAVSSLFTRFLFPISNGYTDSTLAYTFNVTSNIKRVRLCKDPRLNDSYSNSFYSYSIAGMCSYSSIDYISGVINISGVSSSANANAFTGANMKHVLLGGAKVSISFPDSTNLDYESTKFLIEYSAATSTITLTLKTAVATAHRAAYLLNPVPGYATLDLYAASKNVTIGTI